jgi:hypothetical protein
MDGNTKTKKFRGLSIAALVTGILPYIFTPVIPFILDPASKISVYFSGFAKPIMFSYIAIGFCLTITAFVCGIVDLRKINKGLETKKGRSFDIVGMILGSIGFLYLILVLVLVLFQVL